MRRLVSIVAVLAICGAAGVLAAAGGGDDAGGKTYDLIFDNAFGLTEGGDLRVGGVTAGQTASFEATQDTPPKARVKIEITEPGFGDFREDATCDIRPQSLIGEYFVDCQPGSSGRRLPDGGTVPVEQTTSTIPIDLVNNVLREPYKERFRLIINELGTGLAGRPEDLQEVLRRAHPGLRETSRTLAILGDQSDVIQRFIRDSDTVVAQLEARKREVSRFIDEAGETAEITATRREELRETFRRFPGFLTELRPTMARLEDLADEQIPLLADAQRAAPSLDRFLTRLGPFSEASRPAVRALGQSSVVGRRAFVRGSDEVDDLRRLAAQAPGTARPLRQFLESLDDRRRAIDLDPRGAVGAPPAGDPSQNNGGAGGFTGFESLWNYFFWQTLSLNGFDQYGHVLRLGLTVTKCSAYENRSPMQAESPAEAAEIEEHLEDCNQWLGPHQPGVNQPDPSDGGAAGQAVIAESGRPAGRVGERRGPGEPEAGPVPGQRDISQPQITLPPAVRELLGELPGMPPAPTPGDVEDLLQGELPAQGRDGLGGSGSGQGSTAPAPGPVLDYLLAP